MTPAPVKDEKPYRAFRRKGMSRQKAERIANRLRQEAAKREEPDEWTKAELVTALRIGT